MTAFTTGRLNVRPWDRDLDDPDVRPELERRLSEILVPRVLRHLPSGFGPGEGPGAMAEWIALRRARAQISLVEAGPELVGLVFLFRPGPKSQDLHLGYLLAEEVWGQGVATELISGLVTHLRPRAPLTLHAGVDPDNPASARVLLKNGFVREPENAREDLHEFRLRLTPEGPARSCAEPAGR